MKMVTYRGNGLLCLFQIPYEVGFVSLASEVVVLLNMMWMSFCHSDFALLIV